MRRPLLALGPALLAGFAAAQATTDWGFMPEGGRGLVAEVFGTGEEAAAVLNQKGDAALWSGLIAEKAAGLDEQQARTLAGYLAFNAPIPDPAALPPDGRDLALSRCQSCHSLFTGTLMQRRDLAGWEAVFKSPFHMTIPMTETERHTFAAYAAENMPLRVEDVPPELRF